MKNGHARFDFYLTQLEKLLLNAAADENPALWLYRNNARTPLFMLEGLAKLYGGIHNPKKFEKLETHFKTLEDAIGAIDYYDAFAKQLSTDKKISADTIKFLQSRTAEKTSFLNDLLTEKNWIGENANRLAKIREKLNEADWLEEKAEIKAIKEFYEKFIGKINVFAKQYRSGFTELESQVHELRRKLRWLSIYPQALQGCIQLTDKPSGNKDSAKYLTPEIVNSPFNKMPDSGTNKFLLMFEKDYFLALSWLIAELGKLKDEGLRSVVLAEAKSESTTDATQTKSILLNATNICNTFFDEKNLDKLLNGVVKKS
jgi:DNA repair exonuclease SbcCD ATPase subunit